MVVRDTESNVFKIVESRSLLKNIKLRFIPHIPGAYH